MAASPEAAATAWEDREGPVVLTTVSADGVPNSICATCTARYGDDSFLILS